VEVGGVEIRLRSGEVSSIPQDAKEYYVRSFEYIERHFVDCIKNDKEPITSGSDNLRSLGIVFSAYRSSDIKRTVYLGEGTDDS
jgi:predicted dehydrogenase